MTGTPDLDSLSRDDLKKLVEAQQEEITALKGIVGTLKDEIARLKGLKGKPSIKPSGMEQGLRTDAKKGLRDKKTKRGRGPVNASSERIEVQVLKVGAPEGSRFKGYEEVTVRDLVIEARVIRYRRERWLTPDGRLITAPLPDGVAGQFGPALCRYIIALYYQGQLTVPRLVEHLTSIGVQISKRQVLRIIHGAAMPGFRDEAVAALRTGLETADWISVDDTGARHQAKNGVCTQVGNDHFTWFCTTVSKSRLNFLQVLRAGHTDYQINDAAIAYMRARQLAGPVIACLAQHAEHSFPDQAAWNAHLKRLGITDLKVQPNPVQIATEGAVWGSIQAHGFLKDTVILSDDAGQFNVGLHALCWVHAERLIHKLVPATPRQRAAQQQVRCLVWWFYADLKAWRRKPTARRKAELKRRFDRLFQRQTGYATLDRLLARLHANKDELLRVLDRPETPLNTNGSENDIRCHVTKRKISAGTRSDQGRQSRDTFLSLYKTCKKLGLAFWDYLGARLNVPIAPDIPKLPQIIQARANAN